MTGTRETAASATPDAERDAWAVLASVASLGPAGFEALLRSFGTGRRVLEVARGPDGPDRLIDATRPPQPEATGTPPARLTAKTAAAIVDAATTMPRILERIRVLGLTVVTVDDPRYPRRLGAIEAPPPVLFVRGDPAVMDREHAVAIVGTRRATSRGRGRAARIAVALSNAGATVVSGLAIGIDGAAHAATLAAGGTTVAVLGGGHGRLYPRAHAGLAESIVAAGGAIVTEVGPDTAPTAWSFPRRNRVLSGLSDATVVVEAPARSGGLVTASWALEQGRACFLVPGDPDDPSMAGNLGFLREFAGEARIVAGVAQLLADLGLVMRSRRRRVGVLAAATLTELGGTAAAVGQALLDGHVTVDELVAATNLPVATVLAALTLLEARGLVVGVFGRYRPAGAMALLAPSRPSPRIGAAAR